MYTSSSCSKVYTPRLLMHCVDLRKQGGRSYANTYIDLQVGQPIIALGQRNLIGRTFYGPTPSTDDINTYI